MPVSLVDVTAVHYCNNGIVLKQKQLAAISEELQLQRNSSTGLPSNTHASLLATFSAASPEPSAVTA